MINFSQIIAEKLANNSDQLKTSYFTKNKYTSTKYFILDNVLPVDSVTELYESLPCSDIYHSFNSFREKKYTFARLDQLKTNLPNLITDAFQSMEVINEIQKITDSNIEKIDKILEAKIYSIDISI